MRTCAAALVFTAIVSACGGGSGGGGNASTSGTPSASITANPNPITEGTSSTLSWSASNVGGCVGRGAWDGQVNQTGSLAIGPLYSSATFFLDCATATSSVRVKVNPLGGHLPFERVVVAPGVGAWAKAFADLDGDGKLDIIVSGGPVLRPGIYWYRGSDGQRFLLSANSGGEDLHVVDIDGDGLPDVVANGLVDDPVTGVVGHQKLAWYKNPGKASATSAWAQTVIDGNFVGHETLSADFNGDGKIDILAQVESGGEVAVYVQGASPAAWTKVSILGASTLGIAIAKVDGDNFTDVVGNGYWLKNPGAGGGPWLKTTFFAGAPGTATQGGSAVAAADLDGSGRLDVVLAPTELPNDARGDITRWRFTGDPTVPANWTQSLILSNAINVHNMRIGDMDKNGKKDIIFGEMFTRNVAVVRVGILLNSGTGSFDLQQVSIQGAHNIDVADADGNGWLDIVGSNQDLDSADHGALNIWYNNDFKK